MGLQPDGEHVVVTVPSGSAIPDPQGPARILLSGSEYGVPVPVRHIAGQVDLPSVLRHNAPDGVPQCRISHRRGDLALGAVKYLCEPTVARQPEGLGEGRRGDVGRSVNGKRIGTGHAATVARLGMRSADQ